MENINTKKIAVIIVNWNGLKFLEDCLKSIYKQTYTNFEVYFIDNGSVDDSVDFVINNFSKVRVIKLEKNTGFAKGNNVGIQKAFMDQEIKYIFTLNNDTKIDKDCLFKLVSAIEVSPELGMVAPKMKFFYEDNLLDSIGVLISLSGGGANRGYKEHDLGQYDLSTNIFGVCAGAALYRRTALEDVVYNNEFFDNSFFAYYEDLDLNWRLKLRKWNATACPEAIVYHIHSATGGHHTPFKSYYVNRNRYFLIIKNLPFRYLVLAIILTPYRYLKLLNSMFVKKSGTSYELKKNSSSIKPFLIVFKGFGSLFYNILPLLRKRYFIQRGRTVSLKEVKGWFIKYAANNNKYDL